jgi:hypothetical protein
MDRLRRWFHADGEVTGPGGWALNLAIFRVILCAGVALPFVAGVRYWCATTLPHVSPDAWTMISGYQFLPRGLVTNPTIALALTYVDIAALLLALVGFRTRTALTVAALVSAYVFGLKQNLGKVDHYHHIVWFLAVAAAGPSGAALSVDAFLARRRGHSLPIAGGLATMRCLWALFGLIYFAAGLAKLIDAVVHDWATAAYQHRIIWTLWGLRNLYDGPVAAPTWLEALPSWMLTAGAVGVISFEVATIFLILFRPLRPWVAVAGIGFHMLTGVVLGIWFSFLTPAYVALIDWAAILGWFGLRRLPDAPSGPRPRLVAWVGGGFIVAQAVVSVTAAVLPRVPQPKWPFDCYPTFTGYRSDVIPLWRARLVDASGQAREVDAETWRRAMPSTLERLTLTRVIAAAPEPERRELSRQLAARLIAGLPEETRAGVVAVTVEREDLGIGPPLHEIATEPLYRFEPADLAP